MLNSEQLVKLRHIIEQEFSGGAKLTELISYLVREGHGHSSIETLEENIKSHSECGLKILNYSSPLYKREKTFVYIPLEGQ